MLRKLTINQRDYLPLLLRVGLGLVLIPQGFSMMMNYYDTLDWLTGSTHLPLFVAYLVIVIEFYASLFLIFGFASRLMAGAIGAVVLAAIPYHFTSNLATDWVGMAFDQGVEFHVLLIATAIAVMVTGSGKWSLDWVISHFRY